MLFGLITANVAAMESDGVMSPLDVVKLKSLKSQFEKNISRDTSLGDVLTHLIKAASYDELITILDGLGFDRDSQRLFPCLTQPFDYGHVVFTVYSLFSLDVWKQSQHGSKTADVIAYLEQHRIGPTNGDRMLLGLSGIKHK